MEFDYVGVIIGDDMFYENNKLKTDFKKRSKNDSSVKGLKGKKIEPLKTQFIGDKIIKKYL
ncbi:DNA/RNA helicase domain-containing protein [Spiroplasma endosymbiont of Panorpa germanica]|uniref:DNA/RNA helicase domain-containing protein n=1 Tax=Spiroplasma endosymbiont of Panorpa germanica TaxID=3066314 RepID=UPI003BB0C939